MKPIKYVSVIVTYNRKPLLIEAIHSMLAQTTPAQKIVVVDNCSTDGTDQAMTSEFGDNEKVDYLRLPENVGGSAGFYQGLARAKTYAADWICLADDDAIFAPDYFTKLSQAAKRYPNYRVLTGTVRLASGPIDHPHRERLMNTATLSVKPVADAEYEHNFECDIFSFCGVVLRRNLIDQIGMPEKDYFIRFDDFEYALRAQKLTKFYNVSDALITHKTTDEGHKISPWKEYYVTRNRVAMTKKHSTNMAIAHLYLVYVMIRKLTAMLVVPARRKVARYLTKAYINGYVDGYRNRLGRNEAFLPGKNY
ncbi:glycosyltransferase family 2 protein [Furfurilactobacillus curtus]|uniref:Glycosyl transferase family 2 n=1 Tax=Furfurilactobacillus curtus TaxID=1746200 RepID=A0ABQ5JNP6_9LACO